MMTLFAVHALAVAEGILAIAPLPGRSGDYARDVETIQQWTPSLVISMTTRAEMIDADAETLGQDMRERGTRWFHMPIGDFGVPDESSVDDWREISLAATSALRGGGRVLVHCKGGCGRSGMAALRLMIEIGEEPDEALTRLRQIRPCAVETDAQLAWAKTGVIPAAT